MNRRLFSLLALVLGFQQLWAAEPFVLFTTDASALSLQGAAISLCADELPPVRRAAATLCADFERVTGQRPQISADPSATILIGTRGVNPQIDRLTRAGKLPELKGRHEQYVIKTIGDQLVIAGSDKRGTVFGIYELSRQIGVSPWYWWADVPVERHEQLSVVRGEYTDGEPAVRYRGLFLNDEAPCLTTWVRNTFGTNYGDHRFYERVFELILRLKGNYLWPAMWGWAFYADDAENSKTADEMGIVIGTSHHEPMARNHQEWARHRGEYGAWDYATNQQVIDRFFREGVSRIADKDDIITIGMRGDGDAPMGGEEGKDHEYVSRDQANFNLLVKVIENQRKIIKEVTGQAPEKHPQLWALYKEVQKYYDMGLRVPDDVIILLSDDNWGDVRRLPNAKERKHPGGWGMYYHVDYVGAPRNSKWLNVTPIQNLWEQMSLTYEYGVDKLWVLNVGDLKPMEYPITLFLDMAWNPVKYNASTLLNHAREFCARSFGENQADEAARILNLYSKYNGRVTAEMLDASTYNLNTGEWKQVRDDYMVLEAEALRQYMTLEPQYRDAYKQLILFPVQAMANIYDMYYSQAMNHSLYAAKDPRCNEWADRVEKAFDHDKRLANDYNNVMADGKWAGMMIQKHIGYTSWNDNFPADRLPQTFRLDASEPGGYVFEAKDGYVSIEAEHFFESKNAADAEWTVVPYMGRTLSGVTLMPRLPEVAGASLTYRMSLPKDVEAVTVHVITKSTLAFENITGHRYSVAFDGGEEQIINFNENLNENPENIYSIYYPTVAGRVVDKDVKIKLTKSSDGIYDLVVKPLDRGIVFEKIVVDCGGYEPQFLFGPESPLKR